MGRDGTSFGHYELVRRIARGGMAEVFLAIQRGMGGIEREVVVKRILPHMLESPDFVTMFMDEARVAARLSHPNIAHIYDFGQVSGVYYLAMEHVDGLTCSRLVRLARPGRIPLLMALRTVADACAGLHYAHEAKDRDGLPMSLVHRDVSPQNIMVSKAGVAKLLDFGVARASNQLHNTRTGEVKGKFGYISPEQFLGGAVDRRADVFAVGVVLYEIVTGQRLFLRTHEGATVQAVLNVDPPAISLPDVPDELNAIVRRAVAKRPDERYPTALALQEAVEDLAVRYGLVATPIVVGRYVSEQIELAASLGAAAPAQAGAGKDPVDTTPSDPFRSGGVLESDAPGARLEPAMDAGPAALDAEVPVALDGGEDLETEVSEQRGRAASSAPASGVTPGPVSDLGEVQQARRPRLALVVVAAAVLGAGVAVAVMLALTPRRGEDPQEPGPGVVVAENTPPQPGGATIVDERPDAPPAEAVDAGRAEEHDGSAAIPAPADSAPGAPDASPEVEPRRAEQRRWPRAPTKAEPRQTGTLFVHTTPWSRVSVDGRPLGNTPLANVALPAGPHTLVLVDPDGRRHTKRVHVRPSEATKIFVDLRGD